MLLDHVPVKFNFVTCEEVPVPGPVPHQLEKPDQQNGLKKLTESCWAPESEVRHAVELKVAVLPDGDQPVGGRDRLQVSLPALVLLKGVAGPPLTLRSRPTEHTRLQEQRRNRKRGYRIRERSSLPDRQQTRRHKRDPWRTWRTSHCNEQWRKAVMISSDKKQWQKAVTKSSDGQWTVMNWTMDTNYRSHCTQQWRKAVMISSDKNQWQKAVTKSSDGQWTVMNWTMDTN